MNKTKSNLVVTHTFPPDEVDQQTNDVTVSGPYGLIDQYSIFDVDSIINISYTIGDQQTTNVVNSQITNNISDQQTTNVVNSQITNNMISGDQVSDDNNDYSGILPVVPPMYPLVFSDSDYIGMLPEVPMIPLVENDDG